MELMKSKAPITLIECIEYGHEDVKEIERIQYAIGFDEEAKAINYEYKGIKLERIENMSGKTVITKIHANDN